MKNYYFFLFLFLSSLSHSFGQEKEYQTLPSIIKEDLTLTKHTSYITDSNIIVGKNVTITIEEGVVLQMNSYTNPAFLMESGAKLIASGSYNHPIKAVIKNNLDKELDIIVGILPTNKNSTADGQHFTYHKIENPTVLMNTSSAKTSGYADITPDF